MNRRRFLGVLAACVFGTGLLAVNAEAYPPNPEWERRRRWEAERRRREEWERRERWRRYEEAKRRGHRPPPPPPPGYRYR